MIGIVDYGMGNLRSAAKAVEAVGARTRRVDGPASLAGVDAVVLPGVGTFHDAMDALTRAGLVEPLRRHLAQDRPFLGICLGLQLLFEVGDEGGHTTEGLGALAGRVVRLCPPPEARLPVPHIGWNRVRVVRRHSAIEGTLFEGVPDGAHFYFLHGYVARPVAPEVTLAVADYPDPFCAAVSRGAVYATQFHPEKSQALGLRLLRNFIRLSGV